MKWWQDERKAILRPDFSPGERAWIAFALVAGCWLLADLLWIWSR